MTVTLITPQQERLLSDSLVSAIHSVNAGMTPNDALAKSANDHGLTPQFACRMVEAYNASKTVKHLQSTEGEKRAENFELADRDTVLRTMYSPEKTEQVIAKSASLSTGKFFTAVSAKTEKTACESTIFADKLQNKDIKPKGTSETEKKPKDKSKVGLRETKTTKLASLVAKLNHMGQEIRMELAHAKDQILKCACTLESALRTPGHEPFEEIERRVVSTYGSMGKKAMDIVWSMCDFERLGEKRASAPDRLLVMGSGPTYDSARELMSWIEKAARIDHEMAEFQKTHAQVKKLLPDSSGQQPGGTGATFVSDPGMPRRPATAPLVDEAAALGTEGKDSTKNDPEKTAWVKKNLYGIPVIDPSRLTPEEHGVYLGLMADRRKQFGHGPEITPEISAMELENALMDKWDAGRPEGQPSAIINVGAETKPGILSRLLGKTSSEGGTGGLASMDPTGIIGSLSADPKPTSIFDPAQEGKIRSIRTKLVVNDMISNDPVLSAYAPEHVFNAYNELSRMAPGVANEPVVIRSLIGRMLQTGGRMEPNEIKQLLDAEKAHREIRVKGF